MSNVMNYFEIGTPDAAATTAFYGDLFGWQIGDAAGGYGMFEGDKGGIWDTAQIGGGSWAIFYVQVNDVNAAIGKATGLGAAVVVPLTDNGPLDSPTCKIPKGIGSGCGDLRADI